MFLWFQLLTVIIEHITDDQYAIEDMLNYARKKYRNNKEMLKKIEEFGRQMSDQDGTFDAIRWYTSNSFVSQMVNNALKTEDYVVLHKLRAFLKRLIESIKDESRITKEFWEETWQLYSGRSLTPGDIDVLKAQEGEIIAINGFLSTSLTIQPASAYHRDMYFRITTPANLRNIHFASIRHLSDVRDDDEVLFSLCSTFRVGKTVYEHLDENTEGWVVDLNATDDGWDIINTYLLWRKQNYGDSNTIIFGHLLTQMGEYDSALDYFNEYCQNEDPLDLLVNIGCTHLRRETVGDLETAKSYFQKAMTIAINRPGLTTRRARIACNLGTVYDRQQRFDEALYYFEQARQLAQDDEFLLATVNNNIGILYDQGLENYAEAEKYYELALTYYRRYPTHHAYGQTLQNLGCVVDTRGEHQRARCLYYEAQKIYAKTLPPTHSDMRRLLINIAITYHCEGQFNKSISINQTAKDPNDLCSLVEASRLCNLGDDYREKGMHALAMKYAQQGLDMRRKILGKPYQHDDIATALRTIGQIHLARGHLADADEKFHEIETILKLKSNSKIVESSLILASVYDWFGQLLLKRKESKEALAYGELARSIFEHKQITTVIEYATCLITIAMGYFQMKRYNLAGNVANEALNVFTQYLPLHPAKGQAFYWLAYIAMAENDLVRASQFAEDGLKCVQDLAPDDSQLSNMFANLNGIICYRQQNYTNAYIYLRLYFRRNSGVPGRSLTIVNDRTRLLMIKNAHALPFS